MPFYGDAYRLANDADAVRHPGGRSRQAIQSVGIHLVRPCLVLEDGLPPERANDAAPAAARRRREFVWLERPSGMGPITVADFRRPLPGAEHEALLRARARSAWEAWSRLHATIRRWLPAGWGGALPDGPAGPERAE
jgi:hypothetical protein